MEKYGKSIKILPSWKTVKTQRHQRITLYYLYFVFCSTGNRQIEGKRLDVREFRTDNAYRTGHNWFLSTSLLISFFLSFSIAFILTNNNSLRPIVFSYGNNSALIAGMKGKRERERGMQVDFENRTNSKIESIRINRLSKISTTRLSCPPPILRKICDIIIV